MHVLDAATVLAEERDDFVGGRWRQLSYHYGCGTR
jgi:hypothetical protein